MQHKYSILIILFLLLTNLELIAQEALYGQVLVSDSGFSNNIGSANTSRNVAIHNDGTIYVAYTGSLGIRVAKSVDRGQSFLPSVEVISSNFDPEIVVGDDGIVYVSWIDFSGIYLSRSLDQGLTFSDPAFVGGGFGAAPHMAVFDDNVYIVDQEGRYTYTNNFNGVGGFVQTVMPKDDVYADVRTDKNGIVYVPSDDPTLYLSKSTDSGATFEVVNLSSVGDVFFSSYALSDGPAGTFIFVGGRDQEGYKIDVSNGVGSLITLGDNSLTAEGRTLYADSFGALVDGFQDISGDLFFNVSYDQGESFPVSVNVARGGSHNLDRNPLYDDINVAYEQDGNVYMNVYEGLLRGIRIHESVSSVSLCANEDFDLPYTLSGNFSPESEFVVYLSDENGSFENKVFLGSIVSNQDGVIECKIPENTPNNVNYRIQIQSLANFIQSNIVDVIIGGEIAAVKPDDMISCSIISGKALFDLTTQDETIKNGITAAVVSYFESEQDAELDVNPITNPEAYETLTAKTIWARLTTGPNSNCPSFDVTSFDLNIDNFSIDETIYTISRCNTNTSYNLTENESLITSEAGVVFSYYKTQLDLDMGLAIVDPTMYETNLPDSSILIVVENNDKCSAQTSLELTTTVTGSLYNETPLPLELCDSDNDGFEEFSLIAVESDILDGLTASDYEFSYYEALSEAELGSDDKINDPTSFLNTQKDNQTIYAQVKPVGDSCFTVIPFEIIVKTSPISAVKPENLSECSNDNGMSIFNLSSQDTVIINGQADTEISYYTSENDALNKTNEITNTTNYEAANATIWARLEILGNTSTTMCSGFDIVSFELELAEPIVAVPQTISMCSDTLETVYDLTVTESEITTVPNSSFAYYESENDFDLGIEIANPESYTNDALTKTIIVLVANANDCPAQTSVDLITTVNHDYNTAPNALVVCDMDNDGFEEFDLSIIEIDILNGLEPITNYSFTYYENRSDAEIRNTNDIKNSSNYTNTINTSQIIYATIQQPNSTCFQVVPFEIKVNKGPEFTIEPTYSLCLDTNDQVIESSTSDFENSVPIDTGLDISNYEFEWYAGTDSSNGNSIANEIAPSFSPDSQGFYTVVVTDKQSGCKVTATTEVVGSYPPVSIQAEVVSLPFSENNRISVTVEGKGEYEYRIDEGNWQEGNLFSRLSEGEHTVYVRDIFNCDSLSDMAIVIGYPRFFTPNDDGVNDFWKIDNVGIPGSEFIYIYDRFGKLIYQIRPGSEGWNGNFEGKALPSDEYWFVLEYNQITDGTLRQVKGHFSLIR